MRFASLGSGSRGNGTLVQIEGTLLLVDCGFSVREVDRRMERLGVNPADLSGILVTHEHTDHSSGVARLSRRYEVPVYLTHGTQASGRCDDVFRSELFHSDVDFHVGAIRVSPIAVPHDAREPCQFVLSHGALRLGILTDLGSLTPAVLQHYRGCHALLLECNHDSQMLADGAYPASLKRRVSGDWGHLNNHQSARFLASQDHALLQHLVVAHISEKNNCQQRVSDALASCYARTDDIVWADQDSGFDWLRVSA